MPSNYPGQIIDRLYELAIGHPSWTAAQVRHRLEGEFGAECILTRTAERQVKAARELDQTAAWSIEGGEPGALGHVLDVLRSNFENPYPLNTPDDPPAWPTQSEADWIGRIRQARPDIPPRELGQLTYLYKRFAAEERDCSVLDAFLAFTPWRSERDARAFLRSLDQLPVGSLPYGREYTDEWLLVHLFGHNAKVMSWVSDYFAEGER